MDPDPLVFRTLHVEESGALQDTPDLFILMHMLVIKCLDSLLVSHAAGETVVSSRVA